MHVRTGAGNSCELRLFSPMSSENLKLSDVSDKRKIGPCTRIWRLQGMLSCESAWLLTNDYPWVQIPQLASYCDLVPRVLSLPPLLWVECIVASCPGWLQWILPHPCRFHKTKPTIVLNSSLIWKLYNKYNKTYVLPSLMKVDLVWFVFYYYYFDLECWLKITCP